MIIGTLSFGLLAAACLHSPTMEQPTPTIKSAHVRLLVKDFDREFRFFHDVLGFRATFGKIGENYADFDCNGYAIALFRRSLMKEDLAESAGPSEQSGADHAALIFGVSDVDAMAARLKGLGIKFVTEPHDRKKWGIRVAHFRDPEGNLVEINSGLSG